MSDNTPEPRLSRELAAHAAGVKVSTIAMWVSRGWADPATGERHTLEVAARDWRGRPLFRYADVMAAEKATRRRGRKRDRDKQQQFDPDSSAMAYASR